MGGTGDEALNTSTWAKDGNFTVEIFDPEIDWTADAEEALVNLVAQTEASVEDQEEEALEPEDLMLGRETTQDGAVEEQTEGEEVDEEEEPLFCSCQKPYDGEEPMVECSKCTQWYHRSCLGIAPASWERKTKGDWLCEKCKEQSVRKSPRLQNAIRSPIRGRHSIARGMPM